MLISELESGQESLTESLMVIKFIIMLKAEMISYQHPDSDDKYTVGADVTVSVPPFYIPSSAFFLLGRDTPVFFPLYLELLSFCVRDYGTSYCNCNLLHVNLISTN